MQSSNQIISCLDGIINRLGDGTRRKRAYTETNEADDDLYRLLYPCLVERKNNAAAFVMGSRGSGKSRLVDNCLTRMDQSKFHTLRLNGLMIRGNDVGVAVNELVRQLSEIAALQDGRSETTALVRLKRTNFKSNLALLDEMFHLAKVHHHPILIILDEMDLFVRSCPQLVVASDTVDRSPDFSVAFSLYREDLRVSLHEDDTHHAIPKTFSPITTYWKHLQSWVHQRLTVTMNQFSQNRVPMF
jgi:hypothetical protein